MNQYEKERELRFKDFLKMSTEFLDEFTDFCGIRLSLVNKKKIKK